MIVARSFFSSVLLITLCGLVSPSFAQSAGKVSSLAMVDSDLLPEAPLSQSDPAATPSAQEGQAPAQPSTPPRTESDHDKAAEQLKREEKQRILGVVPNFNTSYISDAVALSPKQKFDLAFRSVIDPFLFFAAAADAGISQAENSFPGYGQGAQGYAKRFGASYADDFDGTMLGNAIYPILFKEDPRYFRKGTGSFTSRLLYSIATTVWCKRDNGKWGPNYSNVLGNLSAGGISNLYYPSSDRGAGLTIERGLTVTAEGTIGGVFDEFWPDIARKVFKNRLQRMQQNLPPPSPPSPSAPPPK